ncbi:MAG: hypothetical protein IJ684_01695 [Bacteroidales bacterium]|nr:hypothetical protein [Alloprevotella sp.]MBR1644070.1 hypothetical protein [Bacteroidales bacterium]
MNTKRIMCLAALCITLLAGCSSNADRVQHEIDKENKALSKKAKQIGEELYMDSVWRDPEFVVYEVEYRGDNEIFALNIIDQTRDDFRRLYVGTLSEELRRTFTDGGYGVRVNITGKRTRQKVTLEVPCNELKAGISKP